MPVTIDPTAAPSGTGVLFEYGDVQALLGQVGCGGDATQAGADNEE
jgi:hypothetical protein